MKNYPSREIYGLTLQAFKRPLIPLALSYMIGIGLGSHLAGSFSPALVVGILSAVYIFWQRARSRPVTLAPILLITTLGYLSILPWVAPRFPAHHIIHHLEADPVTLIGRVVNRPRQQSGRTKFIFDTHRLRSDEADTRAAGKVRVTLSGDVPLIEMGQTLKLSGRLRALQNFQNPGGFDYVRSMAYEQIWASLYAPAKRVQVVAAPDSGWLTAGLDRIRQGAGQLIESFADGDPAAVLKALLIGDRSQISPELRSSFSRAGVSHILAISGLHIGIVAATAFALLGWVLRRSHWILQRGWHRRVAAGLTLIPVLAYGLIAGMSPSTQRAVLMAAVFLAAFWVERELDTFSSLAAAAWIILVVYPPSLFAISFQLSFAAVSAIIFGLDRIKTRPRQSADDDGVSRVVIRGRRAIFAMVLVSLFAVWGTLPLTMTYFNQMSFVGVAANLLVVPVVGFCVVPLGLSALCIWPLWSTAAGNIITLSAWLLSLIIPAIEFVARLPVSSLTTWTPTALEIFCYYLITVTVLVLLTGTTDRSRNDSTAQVGKQAQWGLPRYRSLWLRVPLARRLAEKGPVSLLWLTLILSLIVAGGDALYWLHQRYWHRDLKIHILDVGQGNASLVEFPGGHTLLIDGGGFADITGFDPGARVLAPYLRRRKIMTVDTLVLSHPNSDHMNGLIYIADYFNVRQLWTNGEARATLGYRLLMDSTDDHRIQTPDFSDLAGRHTIGGVQVRVLYPSPGFLSRRAVERWRDTNNNSLVVQLVFGDHAFLFPGDITRKAEAELVAIHGSEARSNVLVVPHHGSKSSSSPAFLNAVAPQIAIISARDRGKRRHPHPTVVERYRSRKCRLFYTEKLGAIRLISDGRRLRVEPFITE